MSSSSWCLHLPVKRVWRCLRACLGLRRRTITSTTAGLGQLRKEVRDCEYSDIHVMWDMLSGTGTGVGVGVRDGQRRRRPTTGGGIGPGRVGKKLAAWSSLASYCCALDLSSDDALV